VAETPVPEGEAELLVCVEGLGVSETPKEVDVPEEDVVLEEEIVVLEDEVLEELCVEDVDEEDEALPWLRLHLTVADWLKLEGH
jgi:hypothetical protein